MMTYDCAMASAIRWLSGVPGVNGHRVYIQKQHWGHRMCEREHTVMLIVMLRWL